MHKCLFFVLSPCCSCCRLRCDSFFRMVIKAWLVSAAYHICFGSSEQLTPARRALPEAVLPAFDRALFCNQRTSQSLLLAAIDGTGSRICPNFDIFLITKCYPVLFPWGKSGKIVGWSFCKWMISYRWVWRYY